jgi:hypothetical protein
MKAFFLLALSLLVSGCTDRSDRARMAAIEEKNKRLEDGSILLRQDISQLKSDVKKDEEAVLFLLGKINETDGIKPASLSGTTKGFELARTDYGSFLVSLVDVQPYLDGYKVTLSIGNPLDADVTDGTISVKFGPSEADSLNTVSQAIEEPLAGGHWTNVSVTIAPARAEQLGYMGVSLDPTGMELHHGQ